MGFSEIIIECEVPNEKECCIFTYYYVTNYPKLRSLKKKYLLNIPQILWVRNLGPTELDASGSKSLISL